MIPSSTFRVQMPKASKPKFGERFLVEKANMPAETQLPAKVNRSGMGKFFPKKTVEYYPPDKIANGLTLAGRVLVVPMSGDNNSQKWGLVSGLSNHIDGFNRELGRLTDRYGAVIRKWESHQYNNTSPALHKGEIDFLSTPPATVDTVPLSLDITPALLEEAKTNTLVSLAMQEVKKDSGIKTASQIYSMAEKAPSVDTFLLSALGGTKDSKTSFYNINTPKELQEVIEGKTKGVVEFDPETAKTFLLVGEDAAEAINDAELTRQTEIKHRIITRSR